MNPDNLKETIEETTGIKIETEKDKMVNSLKEMINNLKIAGLNDEEIKLSIKDICEILKAPSSLIMFWIDKLLNGEKI